MNIARTLLPLCAAATLLVAGCSDSGDTATPTTTVSSPVPPSTSASAAANAAPVPNQLQFTATTIDGAEFSGASLAGRRTVLWFWTPWCPTCQREASMIAETADAYPDVQFVGVAAQDDVPAMREFVSEYGVKFPTIADTDGAVWQRFGVTAQPAFAFISKYSDVDIVPGTLSEADLAAQIAALG